MSCEVCASNLLALFHHKSALGEADAERQVPYAPSHVTSGSIGLAAPEFFDSYCGPPWVIQFLNEVLRSFRKAPSPHLWPLCLEEGEYSVPRDTQQFRKYLYRHSLARPFFLGETQGSWMVSDSRLGSSSRNRPGGV